MGIWSCYQPSYHYPENEAKAEDSKFKPAREADTEYLYLGIPVTRATSDVWVI